MLYATETFTADEVEILERHFTNVDRPVFALVNLPEVVKGALFARYSRTHKSLRRLFLDEFADEVDAGSDGPDETTIGLGRAEQLYDKVFLEYGDDSVAQLGGVHLACEQASNVLTKVLEWGRLMAYLEQSTRYIAYDTRLDGRYRYWRDPQVLDSPLGARYVAAMDALFDGYAAALPKVMEWARQTFPKEPGDSDFVWRQTIKAKACDAVRGMLPAASLSNVGIYGTGQAYEALLLRMRAHPLPEVRRYAQMMLEELRAGDPVVPQAGRPGGPGRRLERLPGRAAGPDGGHDRPPPRREEPEPRPSVTLVDYDPEGEDKVLAAILYSASDLPEDQLAARVRALAPGGALRPARRLRGGAGQPPPQARPGLRADGLPLRRAGRLRRLPRPPAPPHAHHRVAAAVDPPRLRGARPGRRGRGHRPVRRGHGHLGRALRRAVGDRSRPRRPTPSPWPTGSGSPCR